MKLSLSDHWTTGPPGPGTPIHWDSDHADGLAAWWPGWEGGGVRWYEEVITGHHATNTGLAPQLLPTDAGFPGLSHSVSSSAAIASDAFTFGQFNPLESATFTLCLRAQITNKSAFGGPFSYHITGRRGVVFISNDAGTGAFTPLLTFYNAAGTQQPRWLSGTTLTVPFTHPLQFVWTWDGTAARLWVDGAEQTLSSVGTGGDPTDGGYIGWAFGTAIGSIYDIRYYNRARPELGPELYDPATRWKIFGSPRITLPAISSHLLHPQNLFGGFSNTPGGYVNG